MDLARKTLLMMVATAVILSLGMTFLAMGGYVEAAGDTYYVDAVNGNDGNTGTGPGAGNAWRTITHAVSQIESGDTIIVAPGTYDVALGEVFPITVTQQDVTFQSSGGATLTVIDGVSGGSGSYSLVDFANDSSGSIDGFTFNNIWPGGYYCIRVGLSYPGGAEVTIGNSKFYHTGPTAISIDYSSTVIRDNLVNNLSPALSSNRAIRYHGSEVVIIRNIIYTDGTGINCDNTSPATRQLIGSNLIYGEGGSGRGIYSDWAAPTIVNNTVDNFSDGLQFRASVVEVTNNIVTNNAASGISFESGSEDYGQQSTIDYNNVWNNGNNYDNCSAGAHDISGDPKYVGASNYRLTDATSPCVDSGNNAATVDAELWTDLDSRVRVWDGNGDSIHTVDMGAYELNSPAAAYEMSLKAEPPSISACSYDTATITATILDAAGAPVVDGIPVVFTTDLGSLGSSSVTVYTSEGSAVATLTAGMSPGVANITVQSGEALATTTVTLTSELCPGPVGGTAHRIDTLALLAPWIALLAVITGASLLLLRRRQTQS